MWQTPEATIRTRTWRRQRQRQAVSKQTKRKEGKKRAHLSGVEVLLLDDGVVVEGLDLSVGGLEDDCALDLRDGVFLDGGRGDSVGHAEVERASVGWQGGRDESMEMRERWEGREACVFYSAEMAGGNSHHAGLKKGKNRRRKRSSAECRKLTGRQRRGSRRTLTTKMRQLLSFLPCLPVPHCRLRTVSEVFHLRRRPSCPLSPHRTAVLPLRWLLRSKSGGGCVSVICRARTSFRPLPFGGRAKHSSRFPATIRQAGTIGLPADCERLGSGPSRA